MATAEQETMSMLTAEPISVGIRSSCVTGRRLSSSILKQAKINSSSKTPSTTGRTIRAVRTKSRGLPSAAISARAPITMVKLAGEVLG